MAENGPYGTRVSSTSLTPQTTYLRLSVTMKMCSQMTWSVSAQLRSVSCAEMTSNIKVRFANGLLYSMIRRNPQKFKLTLSTFHLLLCRDLHPMNWLKSLSCCLKLLIRKIIAKKYKTCLIRLSLLCQPKNNLLQIQAHPPCHKLAVLASQLKRVNCSFHTTAPRASWPHKNSVPQSSTNQGEGGQQHHRNNRSKIFKTYYKPLVKLQWGGAILMGNLLFNNITLRPNSPPAFP